MAHSAATLMIGLWLFSLSAGNFLGAKIAGLAMSTTARGSDPAAFARPFSHVALADGIAALGMLLATPKFKSMLARG
jgi:dipeptide/tripeptide permease